MKKFWLYGLALSIGLGGFGNALGQYTSPPNSLGASAYPIQSNQAAVRSLPQVPVNYHPVQMVPQYAAPRVQYGQPQQYTQLPPQTPFQLVSGQDGAAAYGQAIPQPAPGYPPAPTPAPAVAPTPNMGLPQQAPAVNAPLATAPSYGAGCQSCQTGASNYAYSQGLAPAAGGYAGINQGYDPNCNSCGPAAGGYPIGQIAGRIPFNAKQWYFGANALIFNRVDNKSIPLSFFDSSYASNVLTTRDARMGSMGGFELSAGRYFNCGRNAIEATYWGVFSADEMAQRTRTSGGDYRSRIPFTYLDINTPGGGGGYAGGVYGWFDDAWAHRLERSSEYHNVEVNLLGFAAGGATRQLGGPVGRSMFRRSARGCSSCGGAGCGACSSAGSCGTGSCGVGSGGSCGVVGPNCGSRLSVNWIAGVRYFRFVDKLTYGASLNDGVFSRAIDDLYYDVNTTNDLVGFQLGSKMNYCLGQRFNLYSNAKVGIYGNRSTLYTRIASEFQNSMLNDTRTPANPNNGSAYLFDESKTTLAFLSELGTGLGVRMSCNWTANVGYRAVIASGVATSPDNLRSGFANYADVRDYDTYGTLILHGVSVGAQYNF